MNARHYVDWGSYLVQAEVGLADARRESMAQDCEARLVGIKELIERGEYRVDPRAVADAIMRAHALGGDRVAGAQGSGALRSGARIRTVRRRRR